ncbi:phosphotransferase family protein [Micromonospora polyrhachis]|uniref:Aminoglycoside phosphotransferase (APT) family kinase protein n=1 Tax=Micromonospora polyrhachis TaxID=1282883 RepID=A0A7W7WM78_9ACTN|nr:phosphotransferase family protein [Micromonospora polyrhachis]MBB4956342.1 aminoglycoside phosphotransferase (APT) family kinase protein [Micromonospora polyrhachis]
MSARDAVSLPGLDLDRLRCYLDQHAPDLVDGELRADLMVGGRSNLTYAVTDGTSRWVLRRPPLGHVLATAHDMAREFRVLRALGPVGFPVPTTLLFCSAPAVLGAPFYLMEQVDGVVHRDPDELEQLGPDRVRALVLSLVETLADLHEVRPAGVGLADFGRVEGYNDRQVRRWKRQLDASRSRDVPGIEQLHDRLATAVPDCPDGTIVHGDFRLDNVLVGPAGEIRAVLDWEMSTLGDPLSDLALMLVYAGRPMLAVAGPARSALAVSGHPDTAEITAHYARRSGRDTSNMRWYVAFAAFKLAVILEGVHYRYVHGQTVGPGFDRIGAQVAPLVQQAHETLDAAV